MKNAEKTYNSQDNLYQTHHDVIYEPALGDAHTLFYCHHRAEIFEYENPGGSASQGYTWWEAATVHTTHTDSPK